MDISAGEPPCLDQMVYQTVAKQPSDITPWSWPDMLSLSMMTWMEKEGEVEIEKEARRVQMPMRLVRVDPQVRAGTTGVQTTERFKAIAEVLSRPIGDFQANRFFAFPAMLDTRAVSVLVEAVRSSTGTLRDEAAYVRCMLLSEVITRTTRIGKVTHAVTRVAIDIRPTQYFRQVGAYTSIIPDGVMAAVDLTRFAQLMTRKGEMSATMSKQFGIDTWGTTTAVVPIMMEYSGTKALIPYALSFVTTKYWNMRVGYGADVKVMGTTNPPPPNDIKAYFLHRAAQVMVSGPQNILFVVLDIEVTPSDSVSLEIGSLKVQVFGKNTKGDPRANPPVRTVIDEWVGKENTVGDAPGRQRDAYEALEIMHRLVGTDGVFDTAINITTEATRVFHVGAGANLAKFATYGISCMSDDAATGKHFGQGGPAIKQLGPWDDTARINDELDYARYYFLSPSGMLCEASADLKGGAVFPSLGDITCSTFSLSVSEADYEIRMARALELIVPGNPSIRPRQEMSLTYWLSGNAMLMAGTVYGACLSFGLDWAMLNGLVTLHSDLTTSVRKLVPIYTNTRVQNCIEAKRSLYLEGKKWAKYEVATAKCSSDSKARTLRDVNGFPMPMFMIKAIMKKLGMVLHRPEMSHTDFDFEEDEDSAPLGVVVPAQRNWLFVPWVCDSIDYVRNKFTVISSAPAGKDEKIIEIGVWPYAWADNVSCWGSGANDIELAGRIRLATNATSGRFYADGFLRREVFTYVTNIAASSRDGGEPGIELTLPDPSVGLWQRAWNFAKGWVPKVISDAAPHILSGNLPGVAFEIARNVAEPVLEWLHKKKQEKDATTLIDNMGRGSGGASPPTPDDTVPRGRQGEQWPSSGTFTGGVKQVAAGQRAVSAPPAQNLVVSEVPGEAPGTGSFQSVSTAVPPSE